MGAWAADIEEVCSSKRKEQLGTGYLACKQHPVAYRVYKKEMLRYFVISLHRSLQQLFIPMFWGVTSVVKIVWKMDNSKYFFLGNF